MAEVAIPVIALGVMYLINNPKADNEENEHGEHGEHTKYNNFATVKREGFDNVSAPQQRKLVEGSVRTHQPTSPPINYPKPTYSELTKNTKYYPAPNAATDRYYRQEVYENKVTSSSDPTNSTFFQSLTGGDVQKCDMKHNNMVPFFGSKVTQRTTGFNGNESVLDQLQGQGSQYVRKQAQAPLFKPQKNMEWSNGMPNMSDFIQSRMNPSRNISNTKPWQEIRVGPGLNKGYTNEGSGGFNSGMEARQTWKPKTVDQLRTVTNPKITFGLANHEGPAQAPNFVRGVEGRIEKNRPDTFYVNSPDRWFTTTGQEKAQTVRSAQVLQSVNRPFTSQEYYGASAGNQDGASLAGPAEQNFRKSRRPVLPAYNKYMGQAHNLSWRAGGDGVQDDYGKDGYAALPNSRTTTRQANDFGAAGGWMRAITAPLLDMLRPSRKENVIGNMRPMGNAGGSYGVNETRVWNPSDRPKTTIKEQTIDNNYETQPYYNREGGYETTEYQPIENQRDTTNCPYINNAGATPSSVAGPVYNAAYNANLNPNKEIISVARTNTGTEPLLNTMQNISVGKIGSIQPVQMTPSMPKESACLNPYGEISGKNTREYSQDCIRNDPNMLTAFNNNPYSHSLSSVA